MLFGWFGFGSGALADADGMGEVAVAAERLGFESIWVGEHPVLIDPHEPPSPLPSRSEMMDPIPALAFAAARTERIRLGSGIVILPLRNPVTLAKELATIDVLSQGRLMVGVGVGYVPGEYEAMGVPFNTRGRRADEYVDALRVLWGEEQPSFHGDFVSFDGIQCRPQPMQRPGPPIHASGMSSAARRRAVAARRVGTGSFSTSIRPATRSTSSRASTRKSTGLLISAPSKSRSRLRPGTRSTWMPCGASRTSAWIDWW